MIPVHCDALALAQLTTLSQSLITHLTDAYAKTTERECGFFSLGANVTKFLLGWELVLGNRKTL